MSAFDAVDGSPRRRRFRRSLFPDTIISYCLISRIGWKRPSREDNPTHIVIVFCGVRPRAPVMAEEPDFDISDVYGWYAISAWRWYEEEKLPITPDSMTALLQPFSQNPQIGTRRRADTANLGKPVPSDPRRNLRPGGTRRIANY